MPWIDEALDLLAQLPVCGYSSHDQGATEPSALAALALVGHGRTKESASVGEFLVGIQEPSGSVGVRSGEETPRWPTSLAILAWLAIDKAAYSDPIARAFRWALSIEGERLQTDEVSHNGMLAAWPWVEKGNVAGPRGTHSWLEPSALFVIAFKALGMSDHARTREAVELLVDRILPKGGCNYGNTFVLKQELRPHVQPSGIAMLALRNEFDVRRKIALTLDYLAGSVSSETTTASLAWALLGLAAHGRTPNDADKLLAQAYEQTMKRDKSPHKIALLALAALGKNAPLITLQVAEEQMDKPEIQSGLPADERIGRRAILAVGGLTAAGIIAAGAYRKLASPRDGQAQVFVAKNQKYDGDLARTIRDGLVATGLQPAGIAGKRVLLKPNMVEPTKAARHMTTHPAVVVAVADVFRAWGAEVVVGEAPGHVRDTDMALEESGIIDALDDGKLPFADLNYEPTSFLPNLGKACNLKGFYFPETVAGVDLIVSLPKLKTHHWVGVTASMKNMYGVIPGIRYGWPKNVLHFNGIPQTVFDINASIPKTIAVVDAIDCMEGDGPIMGTKKHMGLLVMGIVPSAVDATVCRLMQVQPDKISYLALAAGKLGPIEERSIQQVGEGWAPLAQPFEILNVDHLRGIRAGEKVS